MRRRARHRPEGQGIAHTSLESQKVTLVRLLRSERTGGVRRKPYGRDHSAVVVERLVCWGGDAWGSAASEH